MGLVQPNTLQVRSSKMSSSKVLPVLPNRLPCCREFGFAVFELGVAVHVPVLSNDCPGLPRATRTVEQPGQRLTIRGRRLCCDREADHLNRGVSDLSVVITKKQRERVAKDGPLLPAS